MLKLNLFGKTLREKITPLKMTNSKSLNNPRKNLNKEIFRILATPVKNKRNPIQITPTSICMKML